MQVKVTEKNGNYALRSTIFQCVLLNSFIILAFWATYENKQISHISNIEIENIGQGHGVQFWHCRFSMANVKIYKCIFFTFLFIFAKVRHMRTKITDRYTHTQTHTHTHTQISTHIHAETEKPMATGEIQQISLTIRTRATRRRVPCKWRQICWNT